MSDIQRLGETALFGNENLEEVPRAFHSMNHSMLKVLNRAGG